MVMPLYKRCHPFLKPAEGLKRLTRSSGTYICMLKLKNNALCSLDESSWLTKYDYMQDYPYNQTAKKSHCCIGPTVRKFSNGSVLMKCRKLITGFLALMYVYSHRLWLYSMFINIKQHYLRVYR